MNKCGTKTEVFSRVCGYHRPIRNWNKGKQQEFFERKEFAVLDGNPGEKKLVGNKVA